MNWFYLSAAGLIVTLLGFWVLKTKPLSLGYIAVVALGYALLLFGALESQPESTNAGRVSEGSESKTTAIGADTRSECGLGSAHCLTELSLLGDQAVDKFTAANSKSPTEAIGIKNDMDRTLNTCQGDAECVKSVYKQAIAEFDQVIESAR